MSTFALAKHPTPILNTAKIPFVYPLPYDDKKRLFAIENIAFPGTKFTVLQTLDGMAQVETKEYPSSQPLFVDARFLESCPHSTPERHIFLPPLESVLLFLERLKGHRYFWGGNWYKGIPQLLELYPPLNPLDPESHLDWTCTGVDCSGILYEATHGWTPRNTSGLAKLGTLIASHTDPYETIQSRIERGDMIVWTGQQGQAGHVIFVLSPYLVLESRIHQGVIETPLKERLEECWAKKQPFMIRRWHPDTLIAG
ncbi:MAG: hypothetical protein JSR58_01595 [Verrucomicrobia bacterium]|nr:hypothetical protein [Verrucomicrobiota bacterium]